MISKIQENNGIYYCSNCRVRQGNLKPNCVFCGNWFSNYEDILIKELANKFINDITGEPPDAVKQYRGLRKFCDILDDAPMMDPNELEEALKGDQK